MKASEIIEILLNDPEEEVIIFDEWYVGGDYDRKWDYEILIGRLHNGQFGISHPNYKNQVKRDLLSELEYLQYQEELEKQRQLELEEELQEKIKEVDRLFCKGIITNLERDSIVNRLEST